jgi:hypothetical protein
MTDGPYFFIRESVHGLSTPTQPIFFRISLARTDDKSAFIVKKFKFIHLNKVKRDGSAIHGSVLRRVMKTGVRSTTSPLKDKMG